MNVKRNKYKQHLLSDLKGDKLIKLIKHLKVEMLIWQYKSGELLTMTEVVLNADTDVDGVITMMQAKKWELIG